MDKTDMIPEPTKLTSLWGDGQYKAFINKVQDIKGAWRLPDLKNSAMRRTVL